MHIKHTHKAQATLNWLPGGRIVQVTVLGETFGMGRESNCIGALDANRRKSNQTSIFQESIP